MFKITIARTIGAVERVILLINRSAVLACKLNASNRIDICKIVDDFLSLFVSGKIIDCGGVNCRKFYE